MRYSIEVVDEVVLSIENGYNAFKMKHKELNTFSGMEYFGLNFDNNLNNSIIFKIYYTNNRSNNETNEFLRSLYKRNMIHTLNKIHDNINYGRVRYEIGLKNRTNDNMIWLYNNLKILYPKLILKEDEIKKISTLKCTDLKNYKYASMYFLGFISTIEDDTIIDIEALKFHYILRKCENPDKIGKKFIINNEDIFDTINKMHIDELDMILNIIKDVINKSNAELWMMGIDYFKNDKCKYKIYIKKIELSILDFLFEKFKSMSLIKLSLNIKAYKKWLINHRELECYGIAICYSHKDGWSVNFYH